MCSASSDNESDLKTGLDVKYSLKMAEIWNQKSLQSPPMNTAKVQILISDLQNLYNNVNEFLAKFDKVQTLNQEAALMSRVIYRMKHKFRSDKGFKTLEKINRALLQYLNMDYTQNLKTFLSMIDTEDVQQPAYLERLVYLPTKQLLEFILVRTQGLAKLLIRIIESCQITAEYMNNRFRLGQSWPLALLVLGLTSRIHSIGVYLVKETCHFYDSVIKYENVLKLNGQVWLPESYKFPEHLLPWLDFNIMENLEINQSSDRLNIKNIKFESNENDLHRTRIWDAFDSSSKNQSPSADLPDLKEDLGLPIARDSVSNVNLPKRKKLDKDNARNKNVNLNQICDAYISRQVPGDFDSSSPKKKVKLQKNVTPETRCKDSMDNGINELSQWSYMQKFAENNCDLDLGLPVSREEYMVGKKNKKKKKYRDENAMKGHNAGKLKKLSVPGEEIKVKIEGLKSNKLKKKKKKIKKIETL